MLARLKIVGSDRDELHRLVDELPADQLDGATEALRSRVRRSRPASWPPAWVGSVEGSDPALSDRLEEILRDEFPGRQA